ncbi:hypothetical protein CLF_103733 [Clonorchis sinensis]|uniref:Uncharacterized protein n=1 Tax=Clonorchis sinensis TaxID=79923 RepID=G7YA98_CLOSI|nr:hypothetical protein CLF_103733 [Clonorchis sinensis]
MNQGDENHRSHTKSMWWFEDIVKAVRSEYRVEYHAINTYTIRTYSISCLNISLMLTVEGLLVFGTCNGLFFCRYPRTKCFQGYIKRLARQHSNYAYSSSTIYGDVRFFCLSDGISDQYGAFYDRASETRPAEPFECNMADCHIDTKRDVACQLSGLDTHKSAGPDSRHPSVPKGLSEEIAQSLAIALRNNSPFLGDSAVTNIVQIKRTYWFSCHGDGHTLSYCGNLGCRYGDVKKPKYISLRTSAMPGLEDLVGCYPLHLAGDVQPQDPKRTLRFHIGFAPPCFLDQPEMNPAAQRTAHPSPLTLKCDVRYGAVQKLKHVRPMMARHCHTQFDSTPATIPFLLSTVPSPTRSINCKYDELPNRPQLTPRHIHSNLLNCWLKFNHLCVTVLPTKSNNFLYSSRSGSCVATISLFQRNYYARLHNSDTNFLNSRRSSEPLAMGEAPVSLEGWRYTKAPGCDAAERPSLRDASATTRCFHPSRMLPDM